MRNTVAVVDISASCHRCVDKFARRLAGKPLVEWIVRQATDCQLIDRVVVVAGKTKAEGKISKLVPTDVTVVRSSRSDTVGRCRDVIRWAQCDAVVRLVCEGPFLDPLWIDRLITAATPDADYVTYGCSDGKPSLLKSAGFFAEWCSASTLEKIDQEASLPDERDDVARFLFARRTQYKIHLLPVPAELDRDDVRVKVDLEEDWEHAQVLFEAIGTDELSWSRVAELLAHQPSLRRRMAVLNREEASAE